MARDHYRNQSRSNTDDYNTSSDNINNYYNLVLEMGIESYVDSDHAKRKNLDYEHSGHTGFASSKELEAEIERAKKAETDAGSSAKEEAERAKQAEEALGARIDAEANKSAQVNEALRADLQNEVARAKEAEGAIDAKVDTESSRAQAAEENIRTTISSEIEQLKLSHIIKAKSEGTESDLLWEDWETWKVN